MSFQKSLAENQVLCVILLCFVFSTMYSYSVSFVGGKMASASGKGKNGGVMEDQPKVVEYELVRSRNLEENERRMEVIRKKELLCGKIWKQTANQKKKGM